MNFKTKLIIISILFFIGLSSASFASAAITYFGSASTPADNGANLTNPTVVTPPASMQTGDLVVMVAQVRNTTGTITISATGGQTWTSETQQDASNARMRVFWCTFNGTWSANPSVTMGSTLDNILTMHVFRPTSGTNGWALDVAQSSANFSAPAASLYRVTVPSITTVTDGAVALAIWGSPDDNTWGGLTPNWNTLGSAQYRNTSGSDASQTLAYRVMPKAGATGAVSKNQTLNGGDAGRYITMAFREVAPTKIYRSVAPGATSALASNSSPSTNTMTISSGTATFVSGLPDNVGVGDVILYDSNDSNTLTSADSIAFIHGRTSATSFTVRTHTGATPTNLGANDTWAIYRAHESLSYAEAGVVNTTLSAMGITYNGGNRDIVTNKEQWNIVCYANGTTADTAAVNISNWTTSEASYIKIYTPTSTNEVGISQRHSGKWDTSKYRLESSNSLNYASIYASIGNANIRIEGLQIKNNDSSTGSYSISLAGTVSWDVHISNNIIQGRTVDNYSILNVGASGATSKFYVYNNVFLNSVGAQSNAIYFNDADLTMYIYNNTIFNCSVGILRSADTAHYIKNNLISATDAFSGTFVDNDIYNDYNAISENTNDATIGANGKYNQTFNFISTTSGSEDLHIASNDTVVNEAGTNLVLGAQFSFSSDIDNQNRKSSTNPIGSDDFATDPSTRWTSLVGAFGWASGAVTNNNNVAHDFSIYNNPTGTTAQYVKVNAYQATTNSAKGVVMRSTGTASDGYYAIVTGQADNNAWITYANASGWVEDMASASLPYSFLTATPGDSIGVTIEGSGPGTVARIWINPVNNTPLAPGVWDHAGDLADVTISLANYAGSNFANTGKYVGLGTWDNTNLVTYDNFYGGSFDTAWDIGADEVTTQIYRSVAPGGHSALEDSTSNLTISGSTATFDSSVSDYIGVGDFLFYDANNNDIAESVDNFAFIHGRTDSTHFTVKTQNGGVPNPTTANGSWLIYRAHTSLFDAEAGIINSNISGFGISFTGGNRDLVANNEEWNIACYANQTNADDDAVTISGWTTGVYNFIKIYTPYQSSEVGVSQRHAGKWSDNKYKIEINSSGNGTSGSGVAIWQSTAFVRIDGLQIKITNNGYEYNDAISTGNSNPLESNIIASNNILQGVSTVNGSDGIIAYAEYNIKAFNNIAYGFTLGSGYYIGNASAGGGSFYFSNNTAYNNGTGFLGAGSTNSILKNNLAVDNINYDYFGNYFASGSVYNLSSDGTADDDADMANPIINANVEFVYKTGYDFHLAQTDTAARQAGTNLTSDSILPITTDIDGQLRNATGTGWDIGADEGTKEFVTTVMQTGGNFASLNTWEDAVDSDLLANTTRVFSHGGITGTIVGGNTVTGQTSGATATVVYATSTQILLSSVSGIFVSGEVVRVSAGNQVTISDNGNPASATAKIDGAWTVEDTTPFDIDGWSTGHDNYVRVYTASASRHTGKWDDTKYRMHWNSYGTMLDILEEYVTIDGIQMQRSSDNDPSGIVSGRSYVTISNNIVKSTTTQLYSPGHGIHTGYDNYHNKIYNNIVYGYKHVNTDLSAGIYVENSEHYIYNNTVFNSDIGISGGYAGEMVARNNLIQDCIIPFDSWYNGAWGSGSDYNITDGLMPPGANSKSETEVNFISTTLGSEDLHLALDDTVARDAGVNLSADSGLAFNTDIDGKSRDYLWDVGADETALQIYRSVAPGATGLLDSDNSHADDLQSVISGVATFEVDLENNIGVGDVLIVDTNNDQSITSADTLLFIYGRNSATSYKLRTHTGAVPTDITSNDTWQIYRAYTSLSNAEAGTINSTLSGLGFSFNGGNRNLITGNEAWNIACYANGTTADTTTLEIDGWTTDFYNFIKVYTPVSSSEVGLTQRHSGKWDNLKYFFQAAAKLIQIRESNVIVDGLQVDNNNNSGNAYNILNDYSESLSNIRISNNILTKSGSANGTGAIWFNSTGNNNFQIFNNIIYNWNTTALFISSADNGTHLYNNTIYNSGNGYYTGTSNDIIAKNNIAQNCTDGFVGTFATGSDYNISDLTSDAPSASYRSGLATNVDFVDETNRDLHLLKTDTMAKNVGTDLSTYFKKDIDGASRPGVDNSAWDIGADEYSIKRVFYSVGQTNASNMVTGSPTLGISNGVGTFSVAQTDNIGVGDKVSHFPSKGIIDDFNRADTSSGYPSAFWRQMYGGMNIDTNTLMGVEVSPDINMVHYRGKSFNADQEAYYTITNKNGGDSFVTARMTDIGWQTYDGYTVYMSDHVAGTDQIEIYRVDDGVPTLLGASIDQEVSNGDSIGIKVIGDGIAAYYKPTGGNWTQLGYRFDSTYTTGGYIGIGEAHDSGSGSALDNFGGGDVDYSYISEKISQTQWGLVTKKGEMPINVSGATVEFIFREFASLSDAVSNADDATHLNTGNLFDNNYELNIPCYFDSGPDTAMVTVDGYDTGEYNFVKIYTPNSTVAEANYNQRHGGKWDDIKYKLEVATNDRPVVSVGVSDVQIEGLQINNVSSMGYSAHGIGVYYKEGKKTIAENILRYSGANNSYVLGIELNNYLDNVNIYNNIIYDFETGMYVGTSNASLIGNFYIYNNTLIDNPDMGIRGDWYSNTYVKNNIVQNSTDGYAGTFDASSDYNISDLSGDAPGGNSKNLTNVEFVNEAGGDFHLAQTDTAARGAGTNLTNDSYSKITTDIDGQLRNPSGVGWDIGADEGTKEFVTTVMQTGGNFASLSTWEDSVDSDLVANTTRVFSHGGITGSIIGGNTVTGQTSGATATVVYATSTQILLGSVNGIFQSGEVVRVSVGNQVTLSDNGNPASVVAMIDGAWSGVDSTNFTIDGWITGADNYIRVYTTSSARHSGKWDTAKYRLEGNLGVYVYENYVKLDGLQIHAMYSVGNGWGIGLDGVTGVSVSNNIIRFTDTGDPSWDPTPYGIHLTGYSYGCDIYNNIIYDFIDETGIEGEGIGVSIGEFNNFYNNTVINSDAGIIHPYAYVNNFKNNLSYGNIDNYYGNFTLGDNSNNLSGPAQNNAPGPNPVNNAGVVFVDYANDDFHLAQTDAVAKNAGTDLSTYFSNDIDGVTRNASINNWDIGADETATQIFRSVAPGETNTLANDDSHSENITISSGVATFSYSLNNEIGVGDVVIVDTGGTDQAIDASDTILFISGRNSATSYALRTHTGAVPVNITSNDTWQIYRAYTSLSDAEAGTINSTLSGLGFSFNGGDRNLMTNNEEWNIACYTNGTTADTTAVDVEGWTTGAVNYLKMYTPVNSNEVGVSQRHNGRWDESKYKLSITNSGTAGDAGIINRINYFRVDGLQVDYIYNSSSLYGYALRLTVGENNSPSTEIFASNNVVRGTIGTSVGIAKGIVVLDEEPNTKIFNNIVYDFINATNLCGGIDVDGDRTHVYNNTVHNSSLGFREDDGSPIFKNNIAQNCTDGFDGGFGVGSNYNISDLATDAPGANSKNSTNVSFADESNKDFHLSQLDTAAKNSGTDLNTYFTNDIDGASRNTSINTWDIGADETATQIYRSVSPGVTGALESDNSHARTVTLTSGIATFSNDLANNIGVGDVVIIDTNNDNNITLVDTLLFIKVRNSSTSYQLQANNGSVPGNIAINDTYQIYRAYTSLSNAESGAINSTLSGLGFSFNGGNRDIVTNNEEWNIACYTNGTTADTTAVAVDGWMTGTGNLVRIYTPNTLNEVGTSQRHTGKWDDNKYNLSISNANYILQYTISDIVIDGLQMKNTKDDENLTGVFPSWGYSSRGVISNNIIVGPTTGSASYQRVGFGMSAANGFTNIYQVYNNIFYNWLGDSAGAAQFSTVDSGSRLYYSNNTFYNCAVGIWFVNDSVLIRNNIFQNITLYATESYDPAMSGSGYNVTDTSAVFYYWGGDRQGVNNQSNTSVSFVDETGYDFHLAQTDTAARQAGTNLTNDSYAAFSSDIDGQLRNPSGVGWDIGADEGTKEFETTVMQTGGNFASLNAWEDAVDSDLVANTTRVFSHGGITGSIIGGNTVTGQTSGATAAVVYATSTQILLSSVSGIFQTGETVQVSAGNSVVISDNGNPASAVAKIDGVWSSADTAAVNIDGWSSGVDNYIKVYTTDTARHRGKTGGNRYFIPGIAYTFGIRINENFTIIDGIEIDGLTDANSEGIISYGDSVVIKNNLLHNLRYYNTNALQIQSEADNNIIFNNIIYNVARDGINVASYNGTVVINNTVMNAAAYGISTGGFNTRVLVRNNISNSPFVDGSNVWSVDSSNNISFDATAPGSSGSKINAEVKFISTEAGNEDFHLHPDDRFAIDAGTDLSTYFTTDIDGNNRAGGWDIGADETATQIFRSVGPGKTDTLDNDNSHTKNVTLTSGVAIFSSALPDNIGVGDVVIIDSNNDNSITSADTLLFVSKRISSTTYQLQANNGSVPGNIAVNDTYQIYRAYTSLFNAEAGTINSTLSGLGFSFTGGNRDLVANNEQWNIACYANGTTADATEVAIDGWNTSQQNFIKIYTPININEVGISQRHDGRWDVNKYKIEINDTTQYAAVGSNEDYIKIEGLEVSINSSLNSAAHGILLNSSLDSNLEIANNIIKSTSYDLGYGYGIEFAFNSESASAKVWNNIVYGFKNRGNVSGGIHSYYWWNKVFVYNNTIYDCYYGIYSGGIGQVIMAKNNITQNCADGYNGAFDATSDYNISDLATDAPGSNSKNSTNVLFLDESGSNFCLDSDDTAAQGAGLNLSTDASLSFFDDIRGQSRPKSPDLWSIGACEAKSAGKIKMENNIKMEGNLKFE